MNPRPWMAAALILALAACGPRAPRKPASVPAEAVWVGAKATGAFVQVGKPQGLGWQVKVWNREGALQQDTVFTVQGMARAEIYPSEITGWDGQVLTLEDGGRLVPQR